MIKLACPIPREVILACSGGKDSVAALNFLLRGKRKVTLAYFNHETVHGHHAEQFVRKLADHHGLDLKLGSYVDKGDGKKPSEADWREQRYDFFRTLGGTILTAHHLNDAAEWWLFTSMRGNPRVIPVSRKDPDMIRPFIKTSKEDFHKVARPEFWSEDPSNTDRNYSRNRIRHEMMPVALKVNPGFLTNVRKLYG